MLGGHIMYVKGWGHIMHVRGDHIMYVRGSYHVC